MSFVERVDRQQAVVFRTFGEDATWSGVSDPVRIRRADRDEEDGWGESRVVVRTRFVRVRQSEVAQPAAEDIVTRTLGGPLLKIIGTPRLDRKRVWTCEVKEVAP